MFPMMLLAIESTTVMSLRAIRFCSGHPEALTEAHLMVREKTNAAVEVGLNVIAGASFDSVVTRYRELVAANTTRLTSCSRS
jgi:hypothetical protein